MSCRVLLGCRVLFGCHVLFVGTRQKVFEDTLNQSRAPLRTNQRTCFRWIRGHIRETVVE